MLKLSGKNRLTLKNLRPQFIQTTPEVFTAHGCVCYPYRRKSFHRTLLTWSMPTPAWTIFVDKKKFSTVRHFIVENNLLFKWYKCYKFQYLFLRKHSAKNMLEVGGEYCNCVLLYIEENQREFKKRKGDLNERSCLVSWIEKHFFWRLWLNATFVTLKDAKKGNSLPVPSSYLQDVKKDPNM